MPAAPIIQTAFLNAFLNNISPTLPSRLFLALYLTNPTDADIGTEISTTGGTEYSRQPIAFGTVSGNTCASSVDVVFGPAGTNWGTINYAALRDDITAGNLLFYGPLTIARFVSNGDNLKFLTGNVTVQIS
jgi:hypothetical protein